MKRLFLLCLFSSATILSQRNVDAQRFRNTKTARQKVCNAQTPNPVKATLDCQVLTCKVTCDSGYAFPNGATQTSLSCKNDQWVVDSEEWENLPACKAVCIPQCQNGGICTDPNTCLCPTGFTGRLCEIPVNKCTSLPPQPFKTKRFCGDTECEIKCQEGYQFPDGSTKINLICKDGDWVQSETEWPSLPDCEAVCNPRCENGGKCDSPNHCKCTERFRGPQCQYDVDNCFKKLNFPWKKTCQDKGTSVSCSLSCPEEMEFKVPPAPTYSCKYSEGTFEPSPIPQCYPKTSTCQAFGDPHYKTFDGRRYDFMGRCSYYLVNTSVLSIATENVGCLGLFLVGVDSPLFPSCVKSVTVKIDGDVIKLGALHSVIVNGEVVKELPYQIRANVTVRKVSAQFLQVDLPYGIKVKFNSLTNAVVQVPLTLRKDLKEEIAGLCGTLNNNPNDDFTTPDGTIERKVVTFANKWKTSDSCGDQPVTLPDPCKNKKLPSSQCRVIKSNIFAKCHSIVNPETYYQDCVYDLCACKGDSSKCLCSVVTAYAEECAHNGIKINWQEHVKSCQTQCPAGQTYQICGNSCATTCLDIATKSQCERECVPGCNCPEGQTLDANGVCVPIEQCQCYHEGKTYPPGHKISIKEQEQTCICKNAKWSCSVIEPPNICKEGENQVFSKCVSKELVTCGNEHENYLMGGCFEGCKCKDGYFLDTAVDKCVKQSDCSCQHEGKIYKRYEIIKKGCSKCQCKHGHWKCTNEECPSSECSVWGESHYKTFDGTHYNFQGLCDYVFAQGHLEDVFFTVNVQSILCGTLGTTCSKSVTIKVKSEGHEDSITLTRDQPLPHHKDSKYLTVREIGLFVIVEAENLGLVVRWDKGTRVYLSVDARWKDKTQGLCGNNNDNDQDDFQTSGKSFGSMWKLNDTCPEPKNVINPCKDRPHRRSWATHKCSVLNSKVFADCHNRVPVDIYLQNCIFDACACDEGGDCECLCAAIAAYAQECTNKGVPIKWRKQDLCPMQCDEPKTYKSCISTCPAETCQNHLYLRDYKKCAEETCVEGCTIKPCPSDYVYLNSSYSECVPKDKCIHKCEPHKHYKEDPDDCQKYQHCEITRNGPEYVDKKCRFDQYFNTETLRCDDKEIVKEVRPECREPTPETPIPTQETPVPTQETPIPTQETPIPTQETLTPTKETPTPTQETPTPTKTGSETPPTKIPENTPTYLTPTPSPTPSEGPIFCPTRPPPICQYGETIKTSKDEKGCPIEICECHPEHCEPLEPLPLEKGYVEIIDDSGCCKKREIVCKEEFCPRKICPEFYEVLEEEPKIGCCPVFHCLPPDGACIYEEKYEAALLGGTRLRTKENRRKVLKPINSTWYDGPCLECSCADYEISCERIRCPSLKEEREHYVVEEKPIYNRCCPEIYRTACKHNEIEYSVGQSWSKTDNPCIIYSCAEIDGKIQKLREIIKCDDKCVFGSEYVPPEPNSGKCCGTCRPKSCVFGGEIYEVGQKWTSEDHCKTYLCINDNGLIQVQSQKVSCPEPPSNKDFVYETIKENNCCEKYKKTACIINGKEYKEGESWYVRLGYECEIISCARNEKNELSITKTFKSCKTTCPLGYTYKESDEKCCGECVQTACIVDGQERSPSESWSSDDYCTNFTCRQDGNNFAVDMSKIDCPHLEDCPDAQIIRDGCCYRCNKTIIEDIPKECRLQTLEPYRTEEIIKVHDAMHGLCKNKQPISNFTVCSGSCAENFDFYETLGIYEKDCDCCRGIFDKPMMVNTECEDGHIKVVHFQQPSECYCSEACATPAAT